jgi:hypothetical protein
LPDIDILTDHRASFHNIFILVIPILIFVFIRDIKIAGIISFYLISHLVLDIFNGGIFLLYPFYDGVFFSRIDMWFSNSGVTTTLDYGISKNIMSTKGEPMISSENIGTAILLIIFILVSTITRWYKHENKL